MKKISINSEITSILALHNIDASLGVMYLFCCYFEITSPQYIPYAVKRAVIYDTNIIKIDEQKKCIFVIPLFTDGNEKQGIDYEQLSKTLMNSFGKVNRERRGVKQQVIKNLKWFFKNYPEYTEADVLSSTERYLATVHDPQYCKKSHKFIHDLADGSILLSFCEMTDKEISIGTGEWNNKVLCGTDEAWEQQ
jgi:hypothetical protein